MNDCLLEGCCRKSIAGRDIALVQSFGEPALPLCKRHELFAKGDQYVFVGMAGTQKAIISYRVGKRDSENTTPSSRTYASAALRFWNVAEIGLLRV